MNPVSINFTMPSFVLFSLVCLQSHALALNLSRFLSIFCIVHKIVKFPFRFASAADDCQVIIWDIEVCITFFYPSQLVTNNQFVGK